MRPIPLKIRKEIARDSFMKKCIYKDCTCKPEWEHAFLYQGKQINEEWNIIPVCKYHHRGKGLNKEYNKYRAIIRADLEDLKRRMPNKNCQQEYNYLTNKFGKPKNMSISPKQSLLNTASKLDRQAESKERSAKKDRADAEKFRAEAEKLS